MIRKPGRQHNPRQVACSGNGLARIFRQAQVSGAHRGPGLRGRQVSGRLLPAQRSPAGKSDLNAAASK